MPLCYFVRDLVFFCSTLTIHSQVQCFTYEGIEAIKPALRAGLKKGEEQEFDVKIQLFSTPVYLVYIVTPDTAHGIKTLEGMIEVIQTSIEKSGGTLKVKAEVCLFILVFKCTFVE